MQAALQEDVDVVGVSLLSAAHMTVMPELVRIRQQLGIERIPTDKICNRCARCRRLRCSLDRCNTLLVDVVQSSRSAGRTPVQHSWDPDPNTSHRKPRRTITGTSDQPYIDQHARGGVLENSATYGNIHV